MKDDSNRSLRRVNRKSRSAADRTVEVDSSAFFAEDLYIFNGVPCHTLVSFRPF